MDSKDARMDEITQKHLPTLMMPKYGILPPLDTYKTRLVIAEDGLYIQSKMPWGSLTKKISELQAKLPNYGHLKENNDFETVLVQSAMPIVRNEMLPDAAKYAEKGMEWQGFVVFEDGDFKYYTPDFKATGGSVKYKVPGNIVADIHSHHTMKPFWSATDDADDLETGGVKIAMVLGKYNPKRKPIFDIKIRYCIQRFHFDYDKPSEKEIVEDFIDEIKTAIGCML